ncbi:phytanoyl-CoA dioxygenase [Streptomyces sp. CB02923]|uniref:phytanoyl-CoA dioxygenase family protein n=1 Tax=Streptomyces sp. CB02923 TaxID=1718985 RepID=UPI0009661C09|nr:phytanoyl-CoA dioxygenase family protein [Streptomyces sp. CB02923]OKI09690.1 phytanoyl-CoA dioxygenase [Streptomyces sp. CB02923]
MLVSTDSIRNAKAEYDASGWHKLSESFDDSDIKKMRESVEEISRQRRPEVVHEKDDVTVRAIHGCHLFDETCARLVRLPSLVRLAETLIGEPVYVYQFKVNLKQPHEGKPWPWHQDFAFWRNEDAMTEPKAVNIAVFLDDTHEENGPLQVVPGSHTLGLLGDAASGGQGDWRRHVSTDLTYTVPLEQVHELEKENPRQQALGPAGTVYAFHPSIVHSSSDNRSPDRRGLLLITYNAVSNAPAPSPRPEFLVSRDTTPITPVDEDEL